MINNTFTIKNKILYFFLLVIGLAVATGVALLFILNKRQPALDDHSEGVAVKNNEDTPLQGNGFDFIVLEIPVIEYEDGNVLSDPVIKGYSQETIRINDEFIIDPATLGYEMSRSVGAIKLILVDIQPDSIIVDVFADVRLDGNFYPRDEIERYNIKNDSCIGSSPLVVDAYYKYCFKFDESDLQIKLRYEIEKESTMPSP